MWWPHIHIHEYKTRKKRRKKKTKMAFRQIQRPGKTTWPIKHLLCKCKDTCWISRMDFSKPGTVGGSGLQPQCSEERHRRTLGACWPAVLANWVSFKPVRPFFKNSRWRTWGKTLKIVLWPPHTCTHVYACTYTHKNTKMHEKCLNIVRDYK